MLNSTERGILILLILNSAAYRSTHRNRIYGPIWCYDSMS